MKIRMADTETISITLPNEEYAGIKIMKCGAKLAVYVTNSRLLSTLVGYVRETTDKEVVFEKATLPIEEYCGNCKWFKIRVLIEDGNEVNTCAHASNQSPMTSATVVIPSGSWCGLWKEK